jgi:hypothetical protein
VNLLPEQNSQTIPAPFLFQGFPGLLGELAVDDQFVTRPGSIEEAQALGRLYGRAFDPSDPFVSIERILSKYQGPTDRYIFQLVYIRGVKERYTLVQDSNGYRVPIECEGLFSYFLSQVESFLALQGAPLDVIRQKLYPRPLPEGYTGNGEGGAWVIGYQRSTGFVTIIDCTDGNDSRRNFAAGSNEVRTPAFKNVPDAR